MPTSHTSRNFSSASIDTNADGSCRPVLPFLSATAHHKQLTRLIHITPTPFFAQVPLTRDVTLGGVYLRARTSEAHFGVGGASAAGNGRGQSDDDEGDPS